MLGTSRAASLRGRRNEVQTGCPSFTRVEWARRASLLAPSCPQHGPQGEGIDRKGAHTASPGPDAGRHARRAWEPGHINNSCNPTRKGRPVKKRAKDLNRRFSKDTKTATCTRKDALSRVIRERNQTSAREPFTPTKRATVSSEMETRKCGQGRAGTGTRAGWQGCEVVPPRWKRVGRFLTNSKAASLTMRPHCPTPGATPRNTQNHLLCDPTASPLGRHPERAESTH